MRRTTLSVLSALAILLSGMIVPEAAAQSRRDKEQTYVLELSLIHISEPTRPY